MHILQAATSLLFQPQEILSLEALLEDNFLEDLQDSILALTKTGRSAMLTQSNVENTRASLPAVDAVSVLEVSSNTEQAANLLRNDDSHWTSDARRGEHWILIRLKPGVVVRTISVVPEFGTNLETRRVTVAGGNNPKDLASLAQVSKTLQE